eukprot:2653415-Pyramimonas_sp.AAC.1
MAWMKATLFKQLGLARRLKQSHKELLHQLAELEVEVASLNVSSEKWAPIRDEWKSLLEIADITLTVA